MTILESESTGEGTPQGVVLALVSTDLDSSKEQESQRILRMYNLASLVSLAKWASTQKVGDQRACTARVLVAYLDRAGCQTTGSARWPKGQRVSWQEASPTTELHHEGFEESCTRRRDRTTYVPLTTP